MKQITTLPTGEKIFDTGEDDMLDKLNAELERLLAEQQAKKLSQSDSLRDKRMAGLPARRRKKKNGE